jgi:hypothetical protein
MIEEKQNNNIIVYLNQTKIMTRKCYEEIIWLRE